MGKGIMTEQMNRWIDAVVKLNKLTQSGELKWTAEIPTSDLHKHPDDRIDAAYSAQYADKELRLYRRTYKEYQAAVGFEALLRKSSVAFRWTTEIRLEFVGQEGMTLWAFPRVGPLKDLLSSAEYQAAGVKDFLDTVLGEVEHSNQPNE